MQAGLDAVGINDCRIDGDDLAPADALAQVVLREPPKESHTNVGHGSHLLVANFSFLHSEINAFNPISGKLRGRLRIQTGINASGGLWTIAFGVGGNNGSPDVLYFTDGINGERDGLFGAIAPNREAPEHECEDCDSQ